MPKMECEEADDYNRRLNTTVLHPGFENAVDDLADKPFCRPVTVEGKLRPGLERVQADVDGDGTTLTQFGRSLMFDAGCYGLTHILADFPENPLRGAISAAKAEERNLRPTWTHLKATALFHWRRRKNPETGRLELTEIRYHGEREVPNGKALKVEKTITVWKSPAGVLEGLSPEQVAELAEKQVAEGLTGPVRGVIETWVEAEGAESASPGAKWRLSTTTQHTFPGIPLTTIYFRRTGFLEAMPPFRHVAWLNIAHWQSASRQRAFLDFTRIPILWLSGADAQDTEITIGASHVNSAGMGAESKLSFVEHRGNAADAGWSDLDRLEGQMREAGMQPFQRSGVGKGQTAMGRAIDASGFQSDAQSMVRALEVGIEGAYADSAVWLGAKVRVGARPGPELAGDEFRIKIFDGFGVSSAEEKKLMETRLDYEGGAIPADVLLATRIRSGVYEKDLDIQDTAKRGHEEWRARKQTEAEVRSIVSPARGENDDEPETVPE